MQVAWTCAISKSHTLSTSSSRLMTNTLVCVLGQVRANYLPAHPAHLQFWPLTSVISNHLWLWIPASMTVHGRSNVRAATCQS